MWIISNLGAWIRKSCWISVRINSFSFELLNGYLSTASLTEVFMGDTGSLALGGVMGAMAVLLKQELLLPIVGGLFVIETLSVIIQVGSVKLTGKRVFRMAPIHHHFELKGWSESKITIRFWIVAFMFALLSLATLKLR